MIYKRKGEETVKQCENWTCQTVWKDSWLERYQDENECPVCGTVFEEGEVTVLEPIKDKPKDKMYYQQMRLIRAEEELAIHQCKLSQLESTPVGFAAAMHGWNENIESVKGRHVSDLGKIAKLRMRCITLQNFIAETNGQIDKLKDIYAKRGENL